MACEVLALSSDGSRGRLLEVAPREGVSGAVAPELLAWKGSHHEVNFSPDGKFLITAMQEPMLHGWRLADRKHMRMSGYSARVRSFEVGHISSAIRRSRTA